jgi:Rrf2 family protein
MLKLTKKTEYALLALGHLGQAGPGETVNVREIADTHQIPFPVLSKVLQRLAREGYVEPTKGAHGGYRLRAELARHNLGQFLEQMEGPFGLVDCIAVQECNQLDDCLIRTPLQVINETILAAFHRMSLAEVIHYPAGAPAGDE